MISDYINLAIENIMHKKLRAWLTIIGIVVGIAAIVALVALGQGFQYTIDQQFVKIGADKITIMPKTFQGDPAASSSTGKLTTDDLDIVRRSSGVDNALEILIKTSKVEFNKKTKYSSVRGMPVDDSASIYKETGMYDAEYGRMLKTGDKNKVVIGSEYAKDTNFGRAIKVNDKININGKDFTVVGIFKAGGNPGIAQAVVITIDDARDLFNERDEVSTIMAKTDKGADLDKVVENIKKDLRRHRDVKEGKEDFTVQSTKQYIESYMTVFDVVTVLLVGLASISLLVGAIGIANTMYTSVLERNREIGVMKSIGATNAQILTIFLIEASLIGLIGGMLGMLLGVGIALLFQQIIGAYLGPGFFKVFLPWWLLVGAAGFALLVGTISGLLPAKQAAEMNPVDALRG
jgi:putative ABC transport system permease protein